MRNAVLLGSLVWGLLLGSPALAGPGAEVSKSRGKAAGVVVLWPRIVPETQDPAVLELATRLQDKIEAAAATTVVPSRVESRPSPERVCPMVGCRATSVGLLLGHQDGGCVALAIVGPPGAETQRLVPLAGKVLMADAALPFREPPEGKVVISEFVPCDQLETQIDPMALAALVGGPAIAGPAAAAGP